MPARVSIPLTLLSLIGRRDLRFPLNCTVVLVVALAMVTVTMVVVVLQEEVLVCAVASKCDGGNAESGEQTLEAVPTAEGSIVAPGLTGSS